jgi:hypothetical protein
VRAGELHVVTVSCLPAEARPQSALLSTASRPRITSTGPASRATGSSITYLGCTHIGCASRRRPARRSGYCDRNSPGASQRPSRSHSAPSGAQTLVNDEWDGVPMALPLITRLQKLKGRHLAG